MNRAWIPILLALALAGCSSSDVSRGAGTLHLALSASTSAAKTIAPTLGMVVSSYTVSGSGPDSSTFSVPDVTGSSTQVDHLLEGEWTITADAYNAADVRIGSGVTTVAVVAGQTASGSVDVAPLAGNGALTVALSWAGGFITGTASVTASLTPAGGTAQGLTFTMGANSASYASGSSLAAGYYTLVLQVLDNSTPVWGCTEAVRILAGQTTGAVFSVE
jgi:hypothetical protein